MKKFGSLLMSTLLCASLLAGCSSSASVSQSTVPETISTAEGAIETGSEEVSLEEMTAAKTETSTEALEESSDDTVVRVGGLKGPTTMGLVKLMDDAKNGTAANNYNGDRCRRTDRSGCFRQDRHRPAARERRFCPVSQDRR